MYLSFSKICVLTLYILRKKIYRMITFAKSTAINPDFVTCLEIMKNIEKSFFRFVYIWVKGIFKPKSFKIIHCKVLHIFLMCKLRYCQILTERIKRTIL